MHALSYHSSCVLGSVAKAPWLFCPICFLLPSPALLCLLLHPLPVFSPILFSCTLLLYPSPIPFSYTVLHILLLYLPILIPYPSYTLLPYPSPIPLPHPLLLYRSALPPPIPAYTHPLTSPPSPPLPSLPFPSPSHSALCAGHSNSLPGLACTIGHLVCIVCTWPAKGCCACCCRRRPVPE